MEKITECLTDNCKSNSTNRIKRIIGQANGLEKMIGEGRYCVDILMQISSVQEALRGLSKELMKNYLEQCVTNNILSKDKEKQDAIYKELMDVIYKYAK